MGSAPEGAGPTGSGAAASGRLLVATPWLAGLTAFAAYFATAAPTIGFGDSPELSAAALSLGVPHPTGYPLLMLLGHGFAQVLAVGDPAWRLNVLAALLAAGAVALAAHFVARATGRAAAALAAGFALAFAPSFWAEATLFEVYGLHLLLLAALLGLWLRFEEQPCPARLRPLVFVAGLSLTHHLMIGLALPVLAVAVLRHLRVFASAGELARLVLLFLLPFALLAYLPLAALGEPLVNWGDPSSPLRFWSHVTGRQYHGNVAGDAALSWWAGAAAPLAALANGPALLLVPFGLLGAAQALRPVPRLERDGQPGDRPRRAASAVLLLVLAAGFGFGSFYEVVDREPFFLNATLAASLLAGLGVGRALDALAVSRPSLVPAASAALVLLSAFSGLVHARASDRSRDFAAHDRAVAELSLLPPQSLLLVDGLEGYPALYASLIEGLRPDVLVVDQYLRVRGDGGGYGPELEQIRHTPGEPPGGLALTVTRVAASLGRPLFLVPGAPDERWSEIGLARVRRGVVDQLVPLGEGRLPAGDLPGSPLAAFRDGPELLSAAAGETRVEPGDPTRLVLRWRWPEASRARALGVVVVAGDAAGELLTDADGAPLFAHAYPLGQGLEPGPTDEAAGWLESIAILLPRALPQGAHSLHLGLLDEGRLVPTTDDRAFVAIGSLDVLARTRPAWTAPARTDATPQLAGARAAH